MNSVALFREGAEAYRKGNYAFALAVSSSILDTSPGGEALVACLNLKALSLAGLGNQIDAHTCLQQAIETSPEDARLHLHASRISLNLGRTQRSLEQVLRACELKPKVSDYAYQLARVYREMGQLGSAREVVRQCLEEFPRFTDGWILLSELASEAGEEMAALEAISRALEVEPDHARALALLAGRGVSSVAGVPISEALLRLLDERFSIQDRATAGFALALLAKQAGNHSAGFARCDKANRLLADAFPFVIDSWEQQLDLTIAESTGWFQINNAGAVPVLEGAGKGLVFIVGMPRSGTSLCEQVLSANSAVVGGGELLSMEIIDKCLRQRGTNPWTEADKPGWIAEMRQVYMDSLPARKPAERFVTDKTPRNAERLGLVFRLFPQAKVIWMMRHPLDIVLSCYFQDFAATQRFSNRLDHAARMLLGQMRLLRHWRSFYPEQIRIMHYGQLIQNLEESAKEMADFIGLRYELAMLEPHLNPRFVRTSSSEQVKKPVYTDSLNNWCHYEAELRNVRVQLQEMKLIDADGCCLPI